MILECTEEEFQKNLVLTLREEEKLNLPPSWKKIRFNMPGVLAYQKGRLRVLFSADNCIADAPWLHVSISRQDRIPNYDEMVEVKKVFIGDDRQAIQVFPLKSKHVNIHPNCLHLWCCLSEQGDGLPDFGKYGTI
jgi:hypothetical protein